MVRNVFRRPKIIRSVPAGTNAAGMVWDEVKWALDSCLSGQYRCVWFPGATVLKPRTRLVRAEVLPAIEVRRRRGAAPGRPAAEMRLGRTARNVRRVFVYPTAPTPTAGSGMDVDKVPASINAVGAGQSRAPAR